MNGSIQENRATIGSTDELRTIKKEPMNGKTGRTPTFSAQNNGRHMGTYFLFKIFVTELNDFYI